MNSTEVKEKMDNLFNQILTFNEDFIRNSKNYDQILQEFNILDSEYKKLYLKSHIDHYTDLKKRLDDFKNSDHNKLIELLNKNAALKKKINKELKLDQGLKKITICNKQSPKSIFVKKRYICPCKYSMFDSAPQSFSVFKVSIEALLDSVFNALLKEEYNTFKFLEDENQIHNFLNYLNENLENLDTILRKIELKIENKSIATINLSSIIKNLKGKYKKSTDFINKLKTNLKKVEDTVKRKNKNIDIIFEYEL